MAGTGGRGFKLGRRASRIYQWGCYRVGAVSRMFKHPKDGTKMICESGRYIRVGEAREDASDVPDGHLAVYVGGCDDVSCRVIIPVVYLNHPLFAELLKKAETVYGFNHPGGIQIPCPMSEFEHVKMRIAAAVGDGYTRRRRG